MLYRDFISGILVNSKSITSDAFIAPKFVYNEIQIAISNLIKQDKDAKRMFWRNTDFFGWKRLNMIELEEVPVTSGAVAGYLGAYQILRSVKPLPEINKYLYGSIIKYVASTNYGIFFDPTNPRQWSSIKKRKYFDKTKRYYDIDGENHLLIPLMTKEDFPLKVVTMEAFVKNPADAEKFNNECGQKGDICKSPLDYEIPVPDYLLTPLEQMVLQNIRTYYLGIPADDYPNLNSDLNNQRDLQNTAVR